MKVHELGHAVIKVRSLERAEAFYNGILGIPIATRMDSQRMTFLTLRSHHDLALLEVGEDAPKPPRNATGLFHLAFKVGETDEELKEVIAHLEANGVKIDGLADHTVSHSIYLDDPDGNGVELFVDASDVWKEDPSQVATIKPLVLT